MLIVILYNYMLTISHLTHNQPDTTIQRAVVTTVDTVLDYG